MEEDTIAEELCSKSGLCGAQKMAARCQSDRPHMLSSRSPARSRSPVSFASPHAFVQRLDCQDAKDRPASLHQHVARAELPDLIHLLQAFRLASIVVLDDKLNDSPGLPLAILAWDQVRKNFEWTAQARRSYFVPRADQST